MALFQDVGPDVDARAERRRHVGLGLLAASAVAVGVLAVTPAPYVIEKPGPVFDTLGVARSGEETVPLIEIEGEPTYPTEGELNLLTVTIQGDPQRRPGWGDVAVAWLQPGQAVLPLEAVFPEGVTAEETAERSRVEMENSQQEAIAAALTELGYEYEGRLVIAATEEGGPADGVLLEGDVIESVNGVEFDDVSQLRRELAENGTDRAAEVVVQRDGERLTFDLVPVLSTEAEPAPILGVLVGGDYEFPFEVTIQLDDVGGPSAGMMFALGIIDKLTPGALTGGEVVAGTGTITASGEVGRIGGVRQKMHAARNEGARWFLAPEGNCAEVAGNVPQGIEVFAVSTLDDSLRVLEAAASGGDTSGLPRCSS